MLLVQHTDHDVLLCFSSLRQDAHQAYRDSKLQPLMGVPGSSVDVGGGGGDARVVRQVS